MIALSHHPAPLISALSGTATATLLGLSPGGVKKLTRAGILHPDNGLYPRADVETLATRPLLSVDLGEITILRANGSPDGPPEGLHVNLDDTLLRTASLGPWRVDPRRVLRNQLFVACVATIPIAVFRITGIADTQAVSSNTIANRNRYRFSGELLGRLGQPPTTNDPWATHANIILTSRIISDSSGPIAYLGGTSGQEASPEEARDQSGTESKRTMDIPMAHHTGTSQ